MALTAKQKAANKAANRVLQRAHRARRQAFWAEEEGIDQMPHVLRLKNDALRVEELLNTMAKVRNAEIARHQKAIDELAQKIKDLLDDDGIKQAKKQRDAVLDAWQKEKQEALINLERRYPDLAGDARFYARLWTPPPEVLAEIEQARRQAEAEVDKGDKK